MANPVLYDGFLFFQHLLTVTFLCVDLIETVVRAKRLPRLRSQLGFKCPICGRDYGHLVVGIQKERDNTAKRSKRYGEHTRATGKRKLLKPVQYSWKNRIQVEACYKEICARLECISKSLAAQSSLSHLEKHRLVLEMCKAWQVKNQLESEAEVQDRLDDEWNIYDNENGKVLWNPIVKIRQYRNYDPLCNVNFPILFYSKVLDKHQRIFYELYTQEERTLMIKAFQLILEYQEIHISKRWPYSLYEWFVIIEYYQACGSAIKTSRMLKALDGKSGGIIPRYIKSRERTIVEYYRKFKQLIPHYGRFMSFIHIMIENDPQLNDEHNIILQNRDHGQMDYEKRILERMSLKDRSLSELCYSLAGKNLNNSNTIVAPAEISNDSNSKTGITKLLDNGIILYETEKISIYHSNPNYKNEVREFTSTRAILKDRLRHSLLTPPEREKLLTEIKEFKASKPKRKIHCGPFHPSRLPLEVIERLRKEGKIRTIDFF